MIIIRNVIINIIEENIENINEKLIMIKERGLKIKVITGMGTHRLKQNKKKNIKEKIKDQ